MGARAPREGEVLHGRYLVLERLAEGSMGVVYRGKRPHRGGAAPAGTRPGHRPPGAAGVSQAHGHQIVHRDIKPENILVTAAEGHGEHVRIVDFGLAKLRNEASVTTGIAVGTPSYMSPEQTVGGKVDERADIYAIGLILYELLVGYKPF